MLSRGDFDRICRGIQATATPELLRGVWTCVAENVEAQNLTLTNFCLHFCTAALQSAPILAGDRHITAYSHRFARYLRSRGLTVHKVLGPYDSSGASASLSLEQLLQACSAAGGLGLSQLELERIFWKQAQGSQGVPPCLSLKEFQAALQAVPEALPEATWAKNLVVQIADHAKKSGSILEASFARLGKEAIDPDEIRKEFAKHVQMDPEQWGTLYSFVDKQSDGCALWRDFLRWSGVVKS